MLRHALELPTTKPSEWATKTVALLVEIPLQKLCRHSDIDMDNRKWIQIIGVKTVYFSQRHQARPRELHSWWQRIYLNTCVVNAYAHLGNGCMKYEWGGQEEAAAAGQGAGGR